VQLFLPQYFRVTWVFLLGFFMDVLLATIIGEHSFALLFSSALASSKARRFRFFSIAQQMIFMSLFCLAYHLMIILVDTFLGCNNNFVFTFGTVLVTMIFWPWLKLLADNIWLTNRSNYP
jgi:rod shape-determining protein MreD